MRMFNLDGSEGKMCGNAIRCVGKSTSTTTKLSTNRRLQLIRSAVSKRLSLYLRGGEVYAVKVDMGKAVLTPNLIPVKLGGEEVIDRPVTIGDTPYNITCVSMGNPHCVVFVDSVDTLDIEKVGPMFEKTASCSPNASTRNLSACSTAIRSKCAYGSAVAARRGRAARSACAAAVAAVENGLCPKGEDITVKLRGGDLVINYTDEGVFMTGSAVKSIRRYRRSLSLRKKQLKHTSTAFLFRFRHSLHRFIYCIHTSRLPQFLRDCTDVL